MKPQMTVDPDGSHGNEKSFKITPFIKLVNEK